tara:strand:- start:315 stop:848 length:534 start_codon:yes stop_codon:yes gene_type:complete
MIRRSKRQDWAVLCAVRVLLASIKLNREAKCRAKVVTKISLLKRQVQKPAKAVRQAGAQELVHPSVLLIAVLSHHPKHVDLVPSGAQPVKDVMTVPLDLSALVLIPGLRTQPLLTVIPRRLEHQEEKFVVLGHIKQSRSMMVITLSAATHPLSHKKRTQANLMHLSGVNLATSALVV